MNHHSTANPWDPGTDELERHALGECAKRQRLDRVSVLVMPANHCELAVQFAELGAQVTVSDEASHRQEVEGRILAAGRREEMSFAPCAMPFPPENSPGEPFDIIFVRRSLCNLPYAEARQVVRQLLQQLKIGGKLYVSILGLHSDLSEGYAGKELPIEDRFTTLSPALAKKYGIAHPVCLYSERNLFMLLLEAGASVLRTVTTTYGNVKAIAVRV
ncbi:MAG: hypothetical protein ACM3X0_15440 [Bacteroidota bacterium]